MRLITRDEPEKWEFIGIRSKPTSYLDEIKGKLQK